MSVYTNRDLKNIYDHTAGYCHLCGKKLSFKSYGKHGKKGAWEVDHSVAHANGGTDHGNNLVAACISCNRSKQAMTTRAIRARSGLTCRPESRDQRLQTEKTEEFVMGFFVVAGILWLVSKLTAHQEAA